MGASPLLARLGLRTGVTGSAPSLAVGIGTSLADAARIGMFSDTTAGSEKLTIVVGGVTGPSFLRSGTAVLANFGLTASQWVKTDASGNLTSVASVPSGAVTAPGANTQVLFNDSGALGASANFTYVVGTLATGYLTVANTTPATTTATGAVVIAGGLGVAGAGFFGGEVSATSAYRFATQVAVVGNNAAASGTNDVVIGSGSDATKAPASTGTYGVAIGAGSVTGARVTGTGGVAIGGNSAGNGAAASDGVAIGAGARATGVGCIAIGVGAAYTNNFGVVIGYGASCGRNNCVVIGDAASVTGGGDNNISIGRSATTSQYHSIAIGYSAASAHDDGVAIGRSAATAKANQIRLGNATYHTEVSIPATTVSTSPTTGALVVDGGVGIGGKTFTAGTLNVLAATSPSDTVLVKLEQNSYATLNNGSMCSLFVLDHEDTLRGHGIRFAGAFGASSKTGRALSISAWWTTFTCSGVTTPPTKWARYTVNSITYVVVTYVGGVAYCFRLTPSTNVPPASGTLTKVSGTGDATLNYSAVSTMTGYSTMPTVIIRSNQCISFGYPEQTFTNDSIGSMSNLAFTSTYVEDNTVGVYRVNDPGDTPGECHFSVMGTVKLRGIQTKAVSDGILQYDSTAVAFQGYFNTQWNTLVTATAVGNASISGTDARLILTSYGTGAYAAFAGRAARGTAASPTATQLGDQITHLSGWGYGATGFSAAARGIVSVFAAENWTDAAQGTGIGFSTTAVGGTTTTEKVRIWSDGGVQIGGTFTASPGADSLHVVGKLTVDGLIDPTGLALTPVAANPGGALATTTLWANSTDSDKLYFGASAVGGGGGSGDVVGPSSAADGGVALFDGVTGKLIKDGGVLGTAAFAATTDFATAAQGGLADSAVQPGSLAAVATSGAYSDLSGTPTIPTLAGNAGEVLISDGLGNADAYSGLTWSATNGTLAVDQDVTQAANGFAALAVTTVWNAAVDFRGITLAITNTASGDYAYPLSITCGANNLIFTKNGRISNTCTTADFLGTAIGHDINVTVDADSVQGHVVNVTSTPPAAGAIVGINATVTTTGANTSATYGMLAVASGASGTVYGLRAVVSGAAPTQWAGYFIGNVSVLGLLQTDASTTTTAGLNLPHGAAPTSPVNGDVWTTTAGMYARVNGTTVGPFGAGGGTPGGSDTQVQFNDGGAFGGDAYFTYNKTTDTLGVGANIQNLNGYIASTLSWADTSVTDKAAMFATAAYYTLSDAPRLIGEQITVTYSCTTDTSARPMFGLWVSAKGDTFGGYSYGITGAYIETTSNTNYDDTTPNYGINVIADHKTNNSDCYGLSVYQELGYLVGSGGTKNGYGIASDVWLIQGENATLGANISAIYGRLTGNMPNTAAAWSYNCLFLEADAVPFSGTPGCVIRAHVTNGFDKLIRFYDTDESRAIFEVKHSGVTTITSSAQTVGASLLNLTATWNAAAQAFGGILVNVTDTASVATSSLLNLQVSSNSKFNVTKKGQTYITALQDNAGPSNNALSIATTFDNASYAFNAVAIAITDTASDTASRFMYCSLGGASRIELRKSGRVWAYDGVDLYSSSTYRVDGISVLGAQGAAVADATGAGDVVAQLNALLARCRAHGFIAT